MLDERSPTADADAAGAPQPPPAPLVLVAEDNAINRAVAKALLVKRGVRVEFAADGLEAVEMVSNADFAAVFMDCHMPKLDGYEAARRIRAAEREREHVPIIAMTAYSQRGERERCLAARMDDYLSKPVRMEELDAVLKRWVPGVADPD